MFGRYSLDEEGLIYAGGEFNSTDIKHFKLIKIIFFQFYQVLILKMILFQDLLSLLKLHLVKKHLTENLDFIADTLGKKKGETAKETIRRYFLNDFL